MKGMVLLALAGLPVAYLFAEGAEGGPTIPAGWAGVSLLSAVLSWLLFIYLPAKDKQLSALLGEQINLVKWVVAEFKQVIEKKDEQLVALSEWQRQLVSTVVERAGSPPSPRGEPPASP